MRSGSLFAGIGGFDLGFQQAGIETIWQVENDLDCNSVLERHWPHVKRYGDVCDVGKSNLEPVDLVCGGFPCQDVSLAGNRAGLSGQRSGLFWQAHRILAELHPAYFVIENVPGLYSSKRLDKKDPLGEDTAVDDDGVGSFLESKDFGIVINALVDIGYCVAWRCLDAEYFGVAQRRRRVFFVGCLGDRTRAAEILLEPESCQRDTPPSREAGQGITRTLTSSLGRSKFDPDRGGFRNGEGLVAHCLRSEGADASEDGTGRGVPIVVGSLTGTDGGYSPDRAAAGQYIPVAFTQNQVGDVLTGDVFPAMGTNSNASGRNTPKVNQGMAVRRLTPTECERLQGFKDGWTAYDDHGKPISDSARYRMLGNAVCTKVSAWIGKRIVAALAGKRE